MCVILDHHMISAEGMRTGGLRGHAPPENFENLSTLGCYLEQSECHNLANTRISFCYFIHMQTILEVIEIFVRFHCLSLYQNDFVSL